MSYKVTLLIFVIFQQSFSLTAQQADSLSQKKGSPVIQVFSSMYYNPFVDKKLGFGIGRAFLGYQFYFDEHFFAKVVIDRSSPTSIGPVYIIDSLGNKNPISISVIPGSNLTMTLKFAYMEYRLNNHFSLQGGSILQNAYNTQEKFWGYRYVAETYIDRYYHIPSSDLGIITYYTFNDKIKIDLALTNGEGFSVEQDVWGKVKIASGIDLNLVKNLQLRIYYSNKSSGDSVNNANEQLLAFFAGYKYKSLFRIGIEYNHMFSFLNVNDLNTNGISFYGSASVFKKWAAFARFDLISFDRPDFTSATKLFNNSTAFIMGIQYHPINKINFSLNYQGWYVTAMPNTSLFTLSMEFKL